MSAEIRCPDCDATMTVSAGDLMIETQCPSCGSQVSLVTLGLDSEDNESSGKLGRFELIEEVGRGGFGSVWKALDGELERSVAVKLPRNQSLDAEGLDKFFREARAAAQLRHPNIVGVHEVGQSEGQPFIVSDFIDGETLCKWNAEERPNVRQIAEQVRRIAAAIHFAHQAGIIHRDLKPANILVDHQGQPHITDFGLAKRESGEVTMTLDGHILGTPAYMSPEQARGQAHAVDAGTDIYSLGVILYELLTGELPFRGSPRMLLNQILNDEPPSPRKLNGRVPRDLETICLQCLRKEPERRYGNAQQLADDLQRYLKGEPIQARPVGRLERTWQLCRRNPGVASLTAALLVALTLGIVLVSWQWLRAERHLASAERSRKSARENFQLAFEAVDEYLSQVTEDPRLTSAGFETLRRDLLRTARDFFDVFSQKNLEDPELSRARAKAFMRLASISRELGDSEPATRYTKEATAAYQQVLDATPEDAEALFGLGEVHLFRGEQFRRARDFGMARKQYQVGLDLLRQASSLEPKNATFKSQIAQTNYLSGLAFEQEGQLAAAASAYDASMRSQESLVDQYPDDVEFRYDLVKSRNNLGQFLWSLEEWERAESLQLGAIDLMQAIVAEKPGVPRYDAQLALCLDSLGILYRKLGRHDDAVAAYQRSLEITRRLAAEHSSVVEYQARYARTLNNFGACRLESGETEAGLKLLQESRDMMEQIVAAVPDDGEYRWALAGALANLGGQQWQADELEDAERNLTAATSHFHELLRGGSSDPRVVGNTAGATLMLADLLAEQERFEEARTRYGQATELLREFAASSQPDQPMTQMYFAGLSGEARSSLALGDYEQAVAQSRAAIEYALPDAKPLADCQLAYRLIRAGELEEGIALAERLAGTAGDQPDVCYTLARTFARASSLALKSEADAGRAKADPWAEEAVTWLAGARTAGWFDDPTHKTEFLAEEDFDGVRDRGDFKEFLKLVATPE